MASGLPPPLKVSPLIKLFRYGMLTTGILYGVGSKQFYKALEESKKEERALERQARDRAVAEEKRRRGLADKREFEKIMESLGFPEDKEEPPAPFPPPAQDKPETKPEKKLETKPETRPEEKKLEMKPETKQEKKLDKELEAPGPLEGASNETPRWWGYPVHPEGPPPYSPPTYPEATMQDPRLFSRTTPGVEGPPPDPSKAATPYGVPRAPPFPPQLRRDSIPKPATPSPDYEKTDIADLRPMPRQLPYEESNRLLELDEDFEQSPLLDDDQVPSEVSDGRSPYEDKDEETQTLVLQSSPETQTLDLQASPETQTVALQPSPEIQAALEDPFQDTLVETEEEIDRVLLEPTDSA